MNVTLNQNCELTPRALAATLASATPEEFANFWFEFSGLMDDRNGNLKPVFDEFANAMADDTGFRRVLVLEKLVRAIHYHEERRKRQKARPAMAGGPETC